MLKNLTEVIDKNMIKTNVDMSKYTTFRTGGSADIFIVPQSIEDIKNVVQFMHEVKSPYYILGNGSNLIVSDEGLRTPVINISKAISDISVFENCITAGAGATLALVARKAYDESLTGFEFAAGIPGSVGGGVIMNAGAYDGEMKDIVEAVRYIDPMGNEHIASNNEMEFSYRKSALSNAGCIIVATTFLLENGNKNEIGEKMTDLAKRRKDKQPLEYPSAGSVFKRPIGNFAGALIESSGLKGYTIGGAQVSEKHAGFIINAGGAKSKDICSLIEYIQDKVYEKHGILLEPEVKYWD